MIVKLSGEINDDMFDNLIRHYNMLEKEELLIIYLNSHGGWYAIMECMIDLINRHTDRTILVAYDTIASCAFELFYSVTCHRELLGGCRGMYHQSTITMSVNENGKATDPESKSLNDYVKIHLKPKTIDLCKRLKFTTTELQDIKKNYDVWFQTKRLKQFLDQSYE